ncbi:MAG: xanthine dehydrogenase family protein molybdopterin-binding subunit [Pseudomonadota bacterium]
MNDMSPIKFGAKGGIGAAVKRKEDAAFVTGAGRYTDDVQPDGALVGYVLRSGYAHAQFSIGSLDDAKAVAGVHLILTHEDVKDLGDIPCLVPLGKNADGESYKQPARPVLAKDIVRYVGDPIAFIVADSKNIASDAAELIEIDYEPLDAVVGAEEALADGAPAVWPGYGARNIAAESRVGEKAATEAALAAADRVVEFKIINNRLVCNYMEPRGCVVEYDVDDDLLTMTLGTQGVHSIQTTLCDQILKIDRSNMRVITPDVGGGFGTKNFMYQEYPLCAVAARALTQPVKWISDRTEHFMTDAHGRDNISTARLGLDANGKFVALDVEILADMGAYLSEFSTIIPWFGASMATGVYDIPVLHAHVTCIYTNTAPTDAYRGAGRPEAAYLLERLVNYAAGEIGMDANELRRINFIKPEQFPYKTPAGRKYDVGEFDGHLTRAMDVAEWDAFGVRRSESEAAGKLRGIGLATYIEACAFAGSEPAKIDLNDDGSVTLYIGTQSTGQGHMTAYAQFISAQLDLDVDRIHVRQGDTNELENGGGTGGSRSIPIGGVSVDRAASDLGEKIKEIASDKLEVAAGDLELINGNVQVVGTDKSITFSDVAAASEDIVTGIGEIKQDEATYPNGTHICELEVDPETGTVDIVRYTVVDDFGVTVNPLLLAGQVHGGIVQGVGQALHERTVYDDGGQLLSASFMDYGMPRADDIPNFHFETRNVPSTTNALGIKGAGEAGSIGSCPAVMNALVDALNHTYGIKHIDMPALPETVWSAIKAAE